MRSGRRDELTRLAVVLHARGEDAEALRYNEQALAIQEKRLPPARPAMADTLELRPCATSGNQRRAPAPGTV